MRPCIGCAAAEARKYNDRPSNEEQTCMSVLATTVAVPDTASTLCPRHAATLRLLVEQIRSILAEQVQ